MDNQLPKLFQKAIYCPEENLGKTICANLNKKERHIALLKLWVFACIALTSLGGLAPAVKILTSDLAKSGFYGYSSLLFSDGGLMLTYWREFALSVTESLPIMIITLTLSLFFAFFFSLRYFMKHIKRSPAVEIPTLSF